MGNGKPGRISAGSVRELHVPGSPGAETRVHSAIHLEKALLSLVRRSGPIPSTLHLGLGAETDSPKDAPVAGPKQIYHCPEKREQRDSYPFQQNDWHPSAAQASARVVIFLRKAETRTPALRSCPPLGASRACC